MEVLLNLELIKLLVLEQLVVSDSETKVLEVYGKVSIADTTSNAGGARYISTEAPTAGVGQEGDI